MIMRLIEKSRTEMTMMTAMKLETVASEYRRLCHGLHMDIRQSLQCLQVAAADTISTERKLSGMSLDEALGLADRFTVGVKAMIVERMSM